MNPSNPSFDCPDCKTNIPGTNCAHELSRLMRWTKKAGCYSYCPCGYPVRAKDIRDNVFSGFIDSNREATEEALIYCETNNGGGHVYFGTYNTVSKGNGKAASNLSSCAVFKRYLSYI